MTMTEADHRLSWSIVCLFLAVLPWIIRFLIDGLPRGSLKEMVLMTTVLVFGLAAPGIGLQPSFVVVLVFVVSSLLAIKSPR